MPDPRPTTDAGSPWVRSGGPQRTRTTREQRAPYFLKVYGPALGHRSQVEVADGSHMPGAGRGQSVHARVGHTRSGRAAGV
jgi:hypothetical protein